MTDWVTVDPGELDEARDQKDQGLVQLRFRAGAWEKRSISEPERTVSEPEAPKPSKPRPKMRRRNATIEDIRNAPPVVCTSDGQWLNQYIECDCGERYIILEEHVAKSSRHRKWTQGNMEVELPKMADLGAFPADAETPPLEFGKVVICSRCKAKDKKGESYFPDRDSRPDQRYPCIRCNGHGVLRLAGEEL